MNTTVRKKYLENRRNGYPAAQALFDARIQERWEWAESAGLVRLDWIPDEDWDIDQLEGDCYSPDVNPNIHPDRLDRERQNFHEKIYQEGVWGLRGMYRLSPDGPWNSADSIWGFVGTDRNGYEEDIMYGTLEQLKAELRGRCPVCRQSRCS